MNFDQLAQNIRAYTVIDVRSPSEYLHGHIPFSKNIFLFSDEERKIIGTIYKKEGKEAAIKKGLGFVQLSSLVEQFSHIRKEKIVLYCARGGMRSSSILWLLQLLGYDVCTLEGGYKSFRKWVLLQFTKKYQLQLIGGFTGVGKTKILKNLDNSIDLEFLANHMGSVFGGFDKTQPTQEHFENLLAFSLYSFKNDCIFIEDESRFIGYLSIPSDFYNQMKSSPLIVLQDCFEHRVNKTVLQYKNYKKEDLKNAVKKIEKRLGSSIAKNVLTCIDEEKFSEACALLFSYYDKRYNFSLSKRDPQTITFLDIHDKTGDQVSKILKKTS